MRSIPLLVLLWFVAFWSSAEAATYTVGTTGDPAGACTSARCSLRQLIAKVHATPFPPDTITVPRGTYTLNPGLGALVVTDNVSIVGAGANRTTIAMPVPLDRSLQGSRVFDIQVPMGGATPTVAISGVTVTGGTAHSGTEFFGGNIRNAGTLTLTDDWITNGSAYSGGGIANVSGTLTIRRSLISGNRAPYGGGDSGGIENFGVPASSGPPATPDRPGHLVVEDSTVTGNEARLVGGIFSWNDATNTLLVSNSTVAGNVTRDMPGGPARECCGGLGVGAGTEVVRNSIIADNVYVASGVTRKRNCGPITSGGITSLGHNIDSGSDCRFRGRGDMSNTNALLGRLQNNGGSTKTLALGTGSPALDKVPSGGAGCAATDQRGIARPQGPACDIGAFELAVVPFNSARPTIKGRPVNGRRLRASRGSWLYGPTGYTYQWLRCKRSRARCAPIRRATTRTYVLKTADVGRRVRVRVVAFNAFGSGKPATSKARAVRPARLRVKVGIGWDYYGDRTQFTSVDLQPVPARTTVVLKCKSVPQAVGDAGCPFKRKRVVVRRAKRRLHLVKHLDERKLAVATTIEIRATKRGFIGRQFRYTTRAMMRPSKRTRCLPPRASKAVRC